MAEHSPQITYNLETDSLEINSQLDEDIKISARQQIIAEALAREPGVEAEVENGTVNTRIEVLKLMADAFKNKKDAEIASIINRMESLVFADPFSSDRVISLRDWFDRAAKGYIFPSFQRYINAGISDDVAKETLTAMARSFGSELEKRAISDYSGYYGKHTTWSFDLGLAPAKFGLDKLEETPEFYVETTGEVAWNNLKLTTLGDCACWGALGEDRGHIPLRSDRLQLYHLNAHNWDYARQSLSMVLGVGVLARHAAQYEGQEDIFAGVEWTEPREIPKSW
ncbi:MAG TPA: hypothetical protein VFT49_00940 [Candidatus Saccharimonadales bacterium]|nr:hypothetical protein [Candidatus Saccharimonadales bacterium]